MNDFDDESKNLETEDFASDIKTLGFAEVVSEYHKNELKNNETELKEKVDIKDVNFVIRKIEPDDELQFSNLNKRFVYDMKVHDPFYGYTDSNKLMSDERNTIYVAVVDEKIVGFVLTYFQDSYFRFDDRNCYICKIYVLPEYRKFNIGKELINEIFNYAHSNDVENIEAAVMSENITAKYFFESLGFEETKSECYSKQVQKKLKNRNK